MGAGGTKHPRARTIFRIIILVLPPVVIYAMLITKTDTHTRFICKKCGAMVHVHITEYNRLLPDSREDYFIPANVGTVGEKRVLADSTNHNMGKSIYENILGENCRHDFAYFRFHGWSRPLLGPVSFDGGIEIADGGGGSASFIPIHKDKLYKKYLYVMKGPESYPVTDELRGEFKKDLAVFRENIDADWLSSGWDSKEQEERLKLLDNCLQNVADLH
ncbi:MAG: hypothetical protein V1918_04370 [Planctomycetota bacterium]